MKTKFLPVGNGHTLHTERVGNINGPTIVFIHGGPGSGYSEKDKDFFDFENHNVIFFDQRSSGKSTNALARFCNSLSRENKRNDFTRNLYSI